MGQRASTAVCRLGYHPAVAFVSSCLVHFFKVLGFEMLYMLCSFCFICSYFCSLENAVAKSSVLLSATSLHGPKDLDGMSPKPGKKLVC